MKDLVRYLMHWTVGAGNNRGLWDAVRDQNGGEFNPILSKDSALIDTPTSAYHESAPRQSRAFRNFDGGDRESKADGFLEETVEDADDEMEAKVNGLLVKYTTLFEPQEKVTSKIVPAIGMEVL